MPGQRFVALTIAALLLCALPVRPASANVPVAAQESAGSPDYALPATFALPWACGESARITWRPEGHWEAGRTRGIAYDFSLVEGTPLYAPAAGHARFLRDDRPLESNLGNYVEIEVEGGWLVRLAHLSTEQTGERDVYAGEFIGLSGSTGATAAHLHLELFVRGEDGQWVCPDLALLPRLYGHSQEELQEEAYLVNDGCAAAFALERVPSLEGDVTSLPLGTPATLRLAARNVGLEGATLRLIGASLRAPDGETRVASLPGTWQVGGKEVLELALPLHLDEAGNWQLTGVTLVADGGADADGSRVYPLPADAAFSVEAAAVALVGLRTPEALMVGDQVPVEAWLENASDRDVALEGFGAVGRTARGEPWEATAEADTLVVPAGSLVRVDLWTREVPQAVGDWRVLGATFLQGGQRYYLGRVDQCLRVDGPDLYVRQVGVQPAPDGADLLVAVVNVGTLPAVLQRLALWATDGAQTYDLAVEGNAVGSLLPGETRLLRVPLGTADVAADLELLDGGCWLDAGDAEEPAAARYVAVRLMNRPGGSGTDNAPDGNDRAGS